MEELKYNIFLDDVRFPKDVYWIKYPENIKWDIICRNYNEFVETIKQYGLPEYCSYDHDMMDFHYLEFHRAWNGDRTLNYDNMGEEKTGYHCVQFLIDFCIFYNVAFPKYFVHTMNPIGKENIENLIENSKKHFDFL